MRKSPARKSPARKSPSKMQSYDILDNGGNPFKVTIRGLTVDIYKQTWTSNGIVLDKKPILTFKPKKIFIGKSPKNKMTEFSGGYGSKWDGNSILLHINRNKYIYIGPEIYSFTSKPIESYVSPVGNSQVPYPFAVDIDKNYYLMEEHVIIHYDDPYNVYYSIIHPDDHNISVKPIDYKLLCKRE